MTRGRPDSTIVIDLTPVRQGGDNGGAKIFSIELIRRLAEVQQLSQFVLLTHQTTHAELACLDAGNVRRQLVAGSGGEPPEPRRSTRQLFEQIARRLPGRARAKVVKPLLRARGWLERRRHASLLHDLGADLLFCPFTSPRYATSGVPTVCVVHDLQYKTYPQFFEPEDVAHRHGVFTDAVRQSTALVAVSDYTRESILMNGCTDPSQVRTIHHRLGRRIALDTPIVEEVLSAHGLFFGRYLLYPANFWRHKNHEMLLLAFELATRGGLPEDVKLVCTGAPGARQEFLIDSAERMGIARRVCFPGYVSNEEFSNLLRGSSGLVFPSLYEGFGMPLVEAMEAGIPIACSNRTALPEVADDAAILFDPRIPSQISAAVVQLCCDGRRRAEMIDAGKSRAACFTDMDRMVADYWQLFQWSMDSNSTRPSK